MHFRLLYIRLRFISVCLAGPLQIPEYNSGFSGIFSYICSKFYLNIIYFILSVPKYIQSILNLPKLIYHCLDLTKYFSVCLAGPRQIPDDGRFSGIFSY